MARNLFLRIVWGRYDFRRRIPSPLRHRFCKRGIIYSLGTVSHSEAIIQRASPLTTATDQLFILKSYVHCQSGGTV